MILEVSNIDAATFAKAFKDTTSTMWFILLDDDLGLDDEHKTYQIDRN
jgi:hypothetical protein